MLRTGDLFTIQGVYVRKRNPDRRWWQLWKPRWVASDMLRTFVVGGKLA